MNSGMSTSAIRLTCHDSRNKTTRMTITDSTLDSTVDSVPTIACCAPTTSPSRRLTRDPVWVRVKNAIGCCCTRSKTWVRRS